eukprot:7380119-Prymnesium_polylepis.1
MSVRRSGGGKPIKSSSELRRLAPETEMTAEQPATALSSASRSRTSPFTTSTPGSTASAAATCDVGSRAMARTLCPRCDSCSTTHRPTAPVAPTTRIGSALPIMIMRGVPAARGE